VYARFVRPRGTLQPGHKAQGTSLCTQGPLFSGDTRLRRSVCGSQGNSSAGTQWQLFSWDTMLRMRVSAPQGNSSAGTQCSGCVFLHPKAKDACFCTPRRLCAGLARLRMLVCAPQVRCSAGTQHSECVFVRTLSSCRENAPTGVHGYSSGGAQGSTVTFQPGHGAQEASRSKTGWLGGRMLDIHRAPGAKLNGSEAA
jgi:hypothetical protein